MTVTVPQLSPTGSFNHAALCSGRRFDPRAVLSREKPIHGLSPEAGYIWGTLRDDNGGLYTIMRRVPAVPDHRESGDEAKSLGGKLLLVSSEGGDGQMHLRREPRFAPDSNELERRILDSSTIELSTPTNEHGRRASVTLTQDSLEYLETDVIDVSGRLVAPPLQWFLPGPDSSLLYLTQTWLVEGRLAGRPVRGFLFWEEAWMTEDARLYVSKDPLHDAEYLTWYSWANHWEDGTAEVGHFLYGNGDFHVAVVAHSDGTVSTESRMEAEVHRAADGYWHDGIDFVIDGEKWVCEADPHGRMEGLGKVPNPQQEGRIHRVSDTRTPDVWMAWGETVPGNGDRRRW